MNVVRVAAGIIVCGSRVFLGLRSKDQHQGGCWEFPGGKCEKGEMPFDALTRELEEECGIKTEVATEFQVITHDYGDKVVELYFYMVTEFSGEPHGREGQETQWVDMSELGKLNFPEANIPITHALIEFTKKQP